MNHRKKLLIFGLIWSLIFFFIAFMPLLSDNNLRVWSIYVSLFFLTISLIYPKFFYKIYFYQIWIKFGNIVGKINSYIIIFLLFFIIFFPMGLILKLFRKDLLGKKISKSKNSYFINRNSEPLNMKNQF